MNVARRAPEVPKTQSQPVTGHEASHDPVDEAPLDPIERAVADIAAGRPVVVVDDADRENEGDLVMAAELITPEIVAFMMSECRGLICVPMVPEELDRLDLPQMVEKNTESMATAFAVSVDAGPEHGVTTGISAADRAATIRLLADPAAGASDFARPGHVFPLRARTGGVLVRDGHTEAAVDLATLAGLRPAGVVVEIAGEDGTMLRLPALRSFARRYGLTLVSIADLVAYIEAQDAAEAPATAPAVHHEAVTALPTAHGAFRAHGYRSAADGVEHIALVNGDLGDGEDVLVRVHSECLTGDIFGSQRCDCGPQLATSLDRISAEGRGVVLYLRGHEGRGIGLLSKLRAYELQERGRDTLDANLELGLPADARDYAVGARILADLGVRSLRLMTNNPDKAEALTRHGLRVNGRLPLPISPGEHNLRYLRTKRDRMGHDLPWLDTAPVSACGNQ
ncbi:bifunctional 3,4-dihydroxy-2-butanone-4-phosphate synthase/GTP cyclohydrolase II [Streptomyces profundus]|uniref:bifunctional 3,4-dihydroxy-2-butanone-4-phosphate synthase/GTP cyclohydrolase II n=1 Tax=Streptomyces profundus TaxID=2867410 RepID=UPI001D165D16|nr:bifunctional 3,4-dihydroxy-2-butanone-4-phosphate synthase/GTP cyclohydrolase II [Streptomyces sp. MA3_2.13]UED82992.1 bifunctional 3,4-dihydroxy-2-butanone-4-phosphate synthase/GTP cyclohydrolase II [Streptomyces sp. MA3_2.13]